MRWLNIFREVRTMKHYILGIESSCDETSVAVYEVSENKLLSNIDLVKLQLTLSLVV